MVNGIVRRMNRSKLKRRATVAGLARIFKTFQGRELTGEIKEYFAPLDAPEDLAQLGTLDRLVLASGCEITFDNNPAILGASGAGRLFIGLSHVYKMPKGARAGESYSFGRVSVIDYDAPKIHHFGHSKIIPFTHRMGDLGGRRPRLILKDGRLALLDGDYKISRAGLQN